MCLKIRFNAEKCCLWGCFSVITLVVVLIVGIISLIYFAHRPYHKYLDAMKSGDGKSAVYYATKCFHKKEKYHKQLKEKYGYSSSNIEWYLNLSYAYELNGEYDVALERYHTIVQQGQESDHNIARVLYRMGRYSESFEMYCECCKEKAETAEPNDFYAQNHLYREIMCHNIVEDSRKFRPYPTFHDFYVFMKAEYEKRGKPQKYVKVMELFRRVDSYTESFMAHHHE
ncbi:MAG: tetratricopeptide repeat protein [Planctomycetaceae bacterium]|nr:tetratricopeptide repeat protein [Planctomycetaceae bacterium]